jgi:ribA/ribD-fused uncharacterized protein
MMLTIHDTVDNFRGEYEFLSNFSKDAFFWYGMWYLTVEHAYQAAKATNPDDWRAIAQANTPTDAKRVGRGIKIRPDWDEVKEFIMMDLLWHKFKKRELVEKLLETGDAMLIEGNTWHDQIWGNCNCERHIDTPGKNLLGSYLMFTRSKLRRLANV